MENAPPLTILPQWYTLYTMKYSNITDGIFLSRQNRFTAIVDIGGRTQAAHIKNTGRCAELFVKNARVILQKSSNKSRKTQYDLIAVYSGGTIVNVDSQCPNKAVGEWLRQGGLLDNPITVKPEAVYGSSRLDFYIENKDTKGYVEVKGVTLRENKTAKFPDAPTARGSKHLTELINAARNGMFAAVIFVIQMKGCDTFEPNKATDPLFASLLKEAVKNGVKIIALDCKVRRDGMVIDKPIKIRV